MITGGNEAWLSSVLQSDVTSSAKNIATGLFLCRTNEAPSIYQLSALLKVSTKTVSRGIRDLEAAGLISRTEGRGRGNITSYWLICSDENSEFDWREFGEVIHEETLDKKRAYRESNRDKILESKRAYWEANREELNIKQRANARLSAAREEMRDVLLSLPQIEQMILKEGA